MLIVLLATLQHAHERQLVHRDVKPDNIYIDRANHSRIILNDWSSAVPINVEYQWVGTKLFSDAPSANSSHTLTVATDLRSLVRTVYCLVRQHMPLCDDDGALQFWQRVSNTHPVFVQAMEFADNADYTGLRGLFGNVW